MSRSLINPQQYRSFIPSMQAGFNMGVQADQLNMQKQEAAIRAQEYLKNIEIDGLAQQAFYDPKALDQLSTISPDRAKAVREQKDYRMSRAAQVAKTILMGTNKPNRNQQYQNLLGQLEAEGIDTSMYPAEYSEDLVAPMLKNMISMAPGDRDYKTVDTNQGIKMLETSPYGFEFQDTGLRGAPSKVAPYVPKEIQIAEELAKARKVGDIQRINDILMAGKFIDKNLAFDEKGNVVPLPNYLETASGVNYAEEAGTLRAKADLGADVKLSEELGAQEGKQISDLKLKAFDAKTSNASMDLAENLLDQGIVSGFGAEAQLGVDKLLRKIGFNQNSDPIANTEAFKALMGKEVATAIKDFGAGNGLSDADREFARQIVAGDITLDEKAIRQIIKIRKQLNNDIIGKYNSRVKNLPKRLKNVAPEIPTGDKRSQKPVTIRGAIDGRNWEFIGD